jgi:Flp pilus assembly protein TadB
MFNDSHNDRRPERPRSEPEIIPPGQELGRGEWSGFMRFESRDGMHRIYMARPGIGSVVLGLLVIGLIVAVIFVVLAGLVLIWIPLLVGGIALALLAGAARYHWWRFRNWLSERR